MPQCFLAGHLFHPLDPRPNASRQKPRFLPGRRLQSPLVIFLNVGHSAPVDLKSRRSSIGVYPQAGAWYSPHTFLNTPPYFPQGDGIFSTQVINSGSNFHCCAPPASRWPAAHPRARRYVWRGFPQVWPVPLFDHRVPLPTRSNSRLS